MWMYEWTVHLNNECLSEKKQKEGEKPEYINTRLETINQVQETMEQRTVWLRS